MGASGERREFVKNLADGTRSQSAEDSKSPKRAAQSHCFRLLSCQSSILTSLATDRFANVKPPKGECGGDNRQEKQTYPHATSTNR